MHPLWYIPRQVKAFLPQVSLRLSGRPAAEGWWPVLKAGKSKGGTGQDLSDEEDEEASLLVGGISSTPPAALKAAQPTGPSSVPVLPLAPLSPAGTPAELPGSKAAAGTALVAHGVHMADEVPLLLVRCDVRRNFSVL